MNNLKVGDVLVSRTFLNNTTFESWYYIITDKYLPFDSLFFVILNSEILDSDVFDPFTYVGVEEDFISYEVVHNIYDQKQSETKNTCICNIFDLMNLGCRCNGL